MAVTQADIDALNDAIKNDARQVTHNGQSVTYRSIPDLVAARNDLQRQLDDQNAKVAGKSRGRQTTVVYGGRGYN